MSKPLLQYPLHPEFEELLNSCGSMTRQLEALGQKLTVTLLQEYATAEERWRIITLNLNQRPVILAASHCALSAEFFCNLLKNASITPIGKFLFAANSPVTRDDNMQIASICHTEISSPPLSNFLHSLHYQSDQQFWQRQSVFNYADEQLFLTEIILPEVELFY